MPGTNEEGEEFKANAGIPLVLILGRSSHARLLG